MKPSPYTDRYSPQQVHDYYAAGYWTADTFHDLLLQRVNENPDKVFATDGTRSFTYRELFEAGQRLAVGLHREGLRRGDRAAVQLPNWVEFIQVLTALSRLGVIMVPVMPIYRREDVGYVLTNAGVETVFTPVHFGNFDYLDMYRGLRREHPGLRIVAVRSDAAGDLAGDGVLTLEELEVASDDHSAAKELGPPPSADEPFVIVYTSGTTSRPKGCVHTFNTFCAGSRGLAASFGYTAEDVQFGPSPIAHTTGLVTSVLAPMLAGGSTHLMAKWSPARGIEEIQRFGCTAAVTAPTFLHTLLSEYDTDSNALSTLRLWTCAGAPVPGAVVQQASAMLPGLKVLSLYGRSENLVTTTCSVADDISRAVTSDGKAMPGSEVRIVDDNGMEVPRGVEGDIAYRGPAHMIEYLANPEETAALFAQDGFSRSGDLGRMTDDGYVRVTGRTKDIVIRGGMNISAREIEDHLAHHPSLHASAVIGMPDERLGEKVCCFLVAKQGHDAPTVEALREYLLAEGVPIQKTPERVVAIDAMPMTATGKTLKHELRKDIERRLREESVQDGEVTGKP